MKKYIKVIGPGLIFASTSIGTSHLVLSTRAGAHHGMIFFWIILGILVIKYPFFEFGPRYASATGQSLIQGYRDQGKWAVILFLGVIIINMFAVTGAVAGISAGLLTTILGLEGISLSVLAGIILTLTALILVLGKYSALDNLIKLISLLLLITVCTAFIAVLWNGPVEPIDDFVPDHDILKGAGLALTVGLLGFMPSGLEVAAMHSIWSVEKMKASAYHPTLRESLLDFHLGYGFATVLALMFMVIGAFTLYGSGQVLEGNSTEFTNRLLSVFTVHIGPWSYYIVALAAFGTIYGTLIAALDGFARSFVRCIRILRFEEFEHNETQEKFLYRTYNVSVPLICLGGFLLFYQFRGGMVKMLDFATILVFLTGPVIAVLNLRAITSKAVPASHRPSRGIRVLAVLGVFVLSAIAIYYLVDIIS